MTQIKSIFQDTIASDGTIGTIDIFRLRDTSIFEPSEIAREDTILMENRTTKEKTTTNKTHSKLHSKTHQVKTLSNVFMFGDISQTHTTLSLTVNFILYFLKQFA